MRGTAICLIVGIYLGAGLFSGLLLQRAIPAINVVGIGYITLTWPRVIYCARERTDCSATGPDWLLPFMFSFPAK